MSRRVSRAVSNTGSCAIQSGARVSTLKRYDCTPDSRVSDIVLPDEGEEVVARAEAVVGIAWEVAAQHFFLAEAGEHDPRDDEKEAGQRPPEAQRKRLNSSIRTAPKYIGCRTRR